MCVENPPVLTNNINKLIKPNKNNDTNNHIA